MFSGGVCVCVCVCGGRQLGVWVLFRPMLTLGRPPKFCYFHSAFKEASIVPLVLEWHSRSRRSPCADTDAHSCDRVPSLPGGVYQDSRKSIWSPLGLIGNMAAGSAGMETACVCRVHGKQCAALAVVTCSSSLLVWASVSTGSGGMSR